MTETINGGSSDKLDCLGSSKTMADEQITTTSPSDTITKTYDYSPNGERLAMLDDDPNNAPSVDETSYYTYDQHQNVEALTGPTGTTIATYGYTAFGADDKTSPTDAASWDTGVDSTSDDTASFPYNSYRFNSGRVSTTTDNLDMGFRTYDPNTANFISRDSYDGSAADAGLAADPYNGDRYAFADGNPISNVEQDGHSWLSTAAGIAGGVLGYGICNAALDAEAAGAGIAICAGIVGGALGGAGAQGVAQGGSCSGASFGESVAIGAVSGLVTSGVAMGIGGLLPEALNSTASGAIEGAGGGAVGGAAGYGTGCAMGQACSWSGLAGAAALGGGLGGAKPDRPRAVDAALGLPALARDRRPDLLLRRRPLPAHQPAARGRRSGARRGLGGERLLGAARLGQPSVHRRTRRSGRAGAAAVAGVPRPPGTARHRGGPRVRAVHRHGSRGDAGVGPVPVDRRGVPQRRDQGRGRTHLPVRLQQARTRRPPGRDRAQAAGGQELSPE